MPLDNILNIFKFINPDIISGFFYLRNFYEIDFVNPKKGNTFA